MKGAGRTKDPDNKAPKYIKKEKEQKRGTKKNHAYRVIKKGILNSHSFVFVFHGFFFL